MIQLETIALPPKSAFGFFSAVPFFGANVKFRKKVVRLLRSRTSFQHEIENIWSLFPFQADIQAILKCIRVNNGWPNALFLPSDSFLALAPLEGHYGSCTADYDTVNGIFFLLHGTLLLLIRAQYLTTKQKAYILATIKQNSF